MGYKKGYGGKSKKDVFPYKYHICHKPGHKAVNCPGVDANNAEDLSLYVSLQEFTEQEAYVAKMNNQSTDGV